MSQSAALRRSNVQVNSVLATVYSAKSQQQLPQGACCDLDPNADAWRQSKFNKKQEFRKKQKQQHSYIYICVCVCVLGQSYIYIYVYFSLLYNS